VPGGAGRPSSRTLEVFDRRGIVDRFVADGRRHRPADSLASRSIDLHPKYDRYGPTIVGTVVSPEAARSTLGVIPG
jgi:hypothetical protein